MQRKKSFCGILILCLIFYRELILVDSDRSHVAQNQTIWIFSIRYNNSGMKILNMKPYFMKVFYWVTFSF